MMRASGRVARFVHYATAFAGADIYGQHWVLCSCGQIMSATNIQTHIIDANKNWREAPATSGQRLLAERDALLEALRALIEHDEHVTVCNFAGTAIQFRCTLGCNNGAPEQARAAIRVVEED